MAFVAGAFLVSCFSFVQALSNYWSRTDPWVGFLYGKYFAFGIHRSYLAVYLLFASCILAYFIRYGEGGMGSRKGKMASLLLGFLLVAVFMTASRAAILALPLLILLFVLSLKEFSLGKRVGIYLCVLLTGLGALFLFPRSQERMERSFQKARALVFQGGEAVGEESDRRLRVWEVARGAFGEHLWTGVGTGDDRSVLLEAYRRKGYEGLVADRLDAHSQYLQTGIALGLPGLFLLLAILIQGWRIGRERSPLLCQLVLLLFLTALFESVLERQAGILFFTFFMPLIAIREGEEEERTIWK
jgi:O-antigen ligase